MQEVVDGAAGLEEEGLAEVQLDLAASLEELGGEAVEEVAALVGAVAGVVLGRAGSREDAGRDTGASSGSAGVAAAARRQDRRRQLVVDVVQVHDVRPQVVEQLLRLGDIAHHPLAGRGGGLPQGVEGRPRPVRGTVQGADHAIATFRQTTSCLINLMLIANSQ